MEKRVKPNRGQIGLQTAESREMGRRGRRKEREDRNMQNRKRVRETEREREREKRGRVKRSFSGYETNSDLIWRVYDSVFSFFSQALRCRLELDWAVA